MNDQAQLFSTGSSATLFTIAEESDLAMMKPKEKERYGVFLQKGNAKRYSNKA
jgi:hypothetical protein